MSENKAERFYWLKMDRKFMDKHYIKILKKIGGPERGSQFLVFYISLLLESIDHNGELRFDEETPYTNEMLAAVTDTDLDIINDAMKIFQNRLGLVEIQEDGTILMTKLKDMIGSETNWAKSKRAYRSAINETESGQCLDNVLQSKSKSKSKEKDIEKDIEKDLSKDNNKEENKEERTSESVDEQIKRLRNHRPWA